MSRTIKQTIPILMYHSISEGRGTPFETWCVSPDQFAAQIQHLADHGFAALSARQFASMLQGQAMLPLKPVVITFDDGFADFIDAALPVLEEHGFAATVFICTAYVGRTSYWMVRSGTLRPMMDWDQLRQIKSAGIECGAHTHTHLRLDAVSPADARTEIATSKQILEDQLQSEVVSLAYPYGYYTRQVKEIARESGFSSACAVRYQMSSNGDDRYALARLIISPQTTMQHFAKLVSGKITGEQIRHQVMSFAWQSLRYMIPYERPALPEVW